MKLSQMLSVLNGLLLSTNVVAITLNRTDELYNNTNVSSSWSYSNTQTADGSANFMYWHDGK